MRSLAILFLLLPSTALAQTTLPKGTAKDESVSKGKTDITTEGFQSAAKKEEDAKDATEFTINGGGLLASGNSKQFAVTGGLNYRLRRGDNQFSMLGVGNYSRASINGGPPEATVENVQGRARYDRFFTSHITGFLGVQARRDRFAGLNLRLQIDPGVGYYFINQANRVFWGELGYDFLFDDRNDDARVQKNAAGKPDPSLPLLPKTDTVHSARAFIGYRYKISDGVQIAAGAEFLQGLSDTEIRRVNADMVVTSKFTDSFSLATSFLLRYDSKPLPGKEHIDSITAINLVYTLL